MGVDIETDREGRYRDLQRAKGRDSKTDEHNANIGGGRGRWRLVNEFLFYLFKIIVKLIYNSVNLEQLCCPEMSYFVKKKNRNRDGQIDWGDTVRQTDIYSGTYRQKEWQTYNLRHKDIKPDKKERNRERDS